MAKKRKPKRSKHKHPGVSRQQRIMRGERAEKRFWNEVALGFRRRPT